MDRLLQRNIQRTLWRTDHFVAPARCEAHLRLMRNSRKPDVTAKLTKEWRLSATATLGSSVRTKGIFLEVRAHLPSETKKLLHVETGMLTLRLMEGPEEDFQSACAIVSKTLESIEDLSVIPREVEDILSITATERHRWLKDGRLHSAGTRTVKLRGRARKITFHVFDPRHIEDVLDRDLVTVWREEDAVAAAENRRRAAGRAALKRATKSAPGAARKDPLDQDSRQDLQNWEEFLSDGLLR